MNVDNTTVVRRRVSRESLAIDCDVCIVGSGAAGSAAAIGVKTGVT